ncbi:MAG: methylglyoxal synthase [Candidatus Latescibacteria bacterium]|jgi:methylglyoxal synthase|nr:methylglyoxal synthase [Candidatus Latescibacterota bacterium]
MGFDFIFMMTENDQTIPNARERLHEVVAGGCQHIGFKDVGLPFDELKGLADDIRSAGARSYLEVVSLDEESEIESARAAVELNVDCLLGGTRAEEVVPIIAPSPVLYYPFPGRIVGHPSVLEGSIDEICDSARRLTETPCVYGLDLLAYRYTGDAPRLMDAVCEASRGPVIMAGSIDREERVHAIAEAGAAGFTVGTAAFSDRFPAETPGVTEQVRSILAMAERARMAHPGRQHIALVAHNGRKAQLAAWVGRHLSKLVGHKLVCTWGTGTMLKELFPELDIERLQSGTRGGDQQIGARIADHTIDIVIFFSDPTTAKISDVDLMALTRLAILHDTPIACSPAAADLFVSARLVTTRTQANALEPSVARAN